MKNCNRKAVDSDGDGEITKDEFVKHALKSRFLQKMLENWMNPIIAQRNDIKFQIIGTFYGHCIGHGRVFCLDHQGQFSEEY